VGDATAGIFIFCMLVWIHVVDLLDERRRMGRGRGCKMKDVCLVEDRVMQSILSFFSVSCYFWCPLDSQSLATHFLLKSQRSITIDK